MEGGEGRGERRHESGNYRIVFVGVGGGVCGEYRYFTSMVFGQMFSWKAGIILQVNWVNCLLTFRWAVFFYYCWNDWLAAVG